MNFFFQIQKKIEKVFIHSKGKDKKKKTNFEKTTMQILDCVRVGVFGCGIDEWDKNIAFSLQNLSTSTSPENNKYPKIQILFFMKGASLGTEIMNLADVPEVDVFFVYGIFFDEYPLLGDYLLLQLKKGKGIVLCSNCLQEKVELRFFSIDGIYGGIADELPCSKGMTLCKDGPFHLSPVSVFHPILEGVIDFDGGSESGRTMAKVLQEKKSKENDDEEQERITLVANWSDEIPTPLIVTKEFLGAKRNYGRIVVLNFWPISDSFGDTNASNWISTTNGDKILRNSVIWSLKCLNSQFANTYFDKVPKFELPVEFFDCILNFEEE